MNGFENKQNHGHFSWLSTSAVLLAAFALLPVVMGIIGIRRSAESEARPFRLPGFVKRLEEEPAEIRNGSPDAHAARAPPERDTEGGGLRDRGALDSDERGRRRLVRLHSRMESGTTLVVSSDGLFEAADADGEPYGFERLHAHLPTLCRRPAAAILEAIVEHWRAHAGPSAPDDDTTLVVIKRL